MGRRKQEVVKNKILFPIFKELSKEELNSYKLSKKLKKAQSTIWEHLKNLENDIDLENDKKYSSLTRDEENKYSINYKFLLEEYIKFIKKRFNFEINPDDFIDNEYLKLFLRELLIKDENSTTLLELFENSIRVIIEIQTTFTNTMSLHGFTRHYEYIDEDTKIIDSGSSIIKFERIFQKYDKEFEMFNNLRKKIKEKSRNTIAPKISDEISKLLIEKNKDKITPDNFEKLYNKIKTYK